MPPLLALNASSAGTRQLPLAQQRQRAQGSPAGCALRTPTRRAPGYGLCLKAAQDNHNSTQEISTLPIHQAGCLTKAHALSTQPVERAPFAALHPHTLAMMVALLSTTATALLEPSAANAAESASSGLMSAGLPASMLVLAAASTSSSNVDLLGLLLHNPILAAVVAVGALVLIPRLIQFSINVLAVPAMVIFVVYLAASHPDTTQAALTGIFRWTFDHPVITSGAILVVATVLLLPSLIVGAGALGAVFLLSQVVAPDFAPTDTSNTTEVSSTPVAGQLTDGTSSATMSAASTTGQQQTGAVVQATDAGSTAAAGSSTAAPAQPKGPLDGLVSKYKVLSALKIVPALPQELTQLPSELPKVAPRPAAPSKAATAVPATAATVTAAPSSAALTAVPEGPEATPELQQPEVPSATASAVSVVPEQPAVSLEPSAAVESEQPAPEQQPAEVPALTDVLSGATLLTLPAAAADLQPASVISDVPTLPEVVPTVDLAAGGEEATDRLTEILERS